MGLIRLNTEMLNDLSLNARPYFERWQVPKSDERLRRELKNIRAITERSIYPKEVLRS